MRLRIRLAGPIGRAGLATVLAAALVASASTAATPADEHHHGTPQKGSPPDRAVVQMLSTKVNTKNFFVPGTVVLTAGEGRKISVLNDTGEPHGFAIDGLGIALTLPSGVETEVALPALTPGLYDIGCQLHPAHRHATLLVLPVGP